MNPGVCHNAMLFQLITQIIEIVMDTAVLSLPIQPVLNLQVAFRIRLSIVGIFLVGVL